MRRLEEGESYRPVSLRDYVTECIEELELSSSVDKLEVHHVYLSNDKMHTHVLLHFGQPNRYLVIVIEHDPDLIFGHYLLDLDQEYGRS